MAFTGGIKFKNSETGFNDLSETDNKKVVSDRNIKAEIYTLLKNNINDFTKQQGIDLTNKIYDLIKEI